MSRQPSRARLQILEILAAQRVEHPDRKALEHPKGRAVELLCQHLGDVNYDAVTTMLTRLHREGLITRQTLRDEAAEGAAARRGKRTYSLDITDAGLALVEQFGLVPTKDAPVADLDLEGLPPGPASQWEAAAQESNASGPVPDPGSTNDVIITDGVDYDLLSRAVLKVVFNNLTASDEVAEMRRDRQRLVQAEAALAEARQVIAAQGEEFEAERTHRVKVEAEAKALSLEVAALREEMAALKDTAIDTARTKGWELRDIASEKSLNALDQLMRSLPSTRS